MLRPTTVFAALLIGCALGGCRDEAVSLAMRVLRPYFGGEQASLIGRPERADALNAAFLNAVSANVLEYDDTHLPTVIHPGAPVAPGLLALAERHPVSGAELLHALILGVEAECRIEFSAARGAEITVERRGQPARTLKTAHRAAFEILTDRADHGVAIVA